jgi:hypothetical protein
MDLSYAVTLSLQCYYLQQVYSSESKLSMCLTKHHAMKTYEGVKVRLNEFLTSALDGGE